MVHKSASKLLTVILLFSILYYRYHQTLRTKSILSPNVVTFLAVLVAKIHYHMICLNQTRNSGSRPEVNEPDQDQQVPKVSVPFRSFHIVETVFCLIAKHQLFSIFSGPNSVLRIRVDRLGAHSKCSSHNELCRFQV